MGKPGHRIRNRTSYLYRLWSTQMGSEMYTDDGIIVYKQKDGTKIIASQ